MVRHECQVRLFLLDGDVLQDAEPNTYQFAFFVYVVYVDYL